jgi:hypothetical protein
MRFYASLLVGQIAGAQTSEMSGDPNRHLVADGACTASPRSRSSVAGALVIDMPLPSWTAGGGALRRAWVEEAKNSGCPVSHWECQHYVAKLCPYFTPLSRHDSAVLTSN